MLFLPFRRLLLFLWSLFYVLITHLPSDDMLMYSSLQSSRPSFLPHLPLQIMGRVVPFPIQQQLFSRQLHTKVKASSALQSVLINARFVFVDLVLA